MCVAWHRVLPCSFRFPVPSVRPFSGSDVHPGMVCSRWSRWCVCAIPISLCVQVRALWVEAVTNATATGLVSGIYADHSAEKGIGIGSNFNFTAHNGVVTPYTKNNQGPNQLCNGRGEGRSCYNFTEEFAGK